MQIKDVKKLLGITVATIATVASLTACSFNPRDNEAVAMYGVEYPEIEETIESTTEKETQSSEAVTKSSEAVTGAETEETKAVVDEEQQSVEETSTEEEYGPNKDDVVLMYGVFPDEDTTEAPEK